VAPQIAETQVRLDAIDADATDYGPVPIETRQSIG